MQAYAVDGFGETGSMRELPSPEPGEGQVRIEVRASGVNPVDVAVVQGYMKDMMEHRFPLIPGIDASGVVDAVGEGVAGHEAGDEVFGAVGKMYFGEGTYAEYATFSAATITRKPHGLTHSQAAAFPTAGVTGLMLLDAVDPSQGDTILAIGAAGGVGSYFVQLARHSGANVVAVCRGANADYVVGLGANGVVDYTAEDTAEAVRSRYPDGVDAIVDMVGDKDEVSRLADRVRPGGRVASCVGAADEQALRPRDITASNVVTVVTSERLDSLVASIARGELRVPEIDAMRLSDAGEALSRIATKHVRGKLVLTVT